MHSCSHHPQSERDPSSLSPSRHVTKSGPRLRWQSDRAALTAHLVVGDRDRVSYYCYCYCYCYYDNQRQDKRIGATGPSVSDDYRGRSRDEFLRGRGRGKFGLMERQVGTMCTHNINRATEVAFIHGARVFCSRICADQWVEQKERVFFLRKNTAVN